jgi:hypothetical protein
MVVLIDDKSKAIKTETGDLLVRVDPNYIIFIKKKNSKKEYDWCIGMVNTFEVYNI